MTDLPLKYGCNPNQKPARLYRRDGGALPFAVLNGNPGYINFMDALNGWQLVLALKGATGLPAAASFKHVSPAGAALGLPLGPELKKALFADGVDGLDDSPVACAYARARGADRLSSFGDFIILSDPCDAACAQFIAREVSDGILAPGYDEEALGILKQKRGGAYCVIRMDGDYRPPETETRDVFGIAFQQRWNDAPIVEALLTNLVTENRLLPAAAKRDLLVSLAVLKYTQSNSVCLAVDGQAVGVGAGQQSRVACVRLACEKADRWRLRQHEKALNLPFLPGMRRPDRDNTVDAFLGEDARAAFGDGRWKSVFTREPDYLTGDERERWLKGFSGVSMGSDAFFPFEDSILRAARSGVAYIAQPGGSVRDREVIGCCDERGMAMAFTGLRLFHH